MHTLSESKLEENTIKKLETAGYEILDPNILKINLRYRIDNLNNIKLTDTEFKRLWKDLQQGDEFKKAETLRNGILLIRDDSSQKTINLISSVPGENIFQVASQVKNNGKRDNRYDITLLFNGLPLIQIELKKTGISLSKAFNQIKRYKKESYVNSDTLDNLFEFIQIFVISDGVTTKYFSNNKELFENFVFEWTDKDNNKISKIDNFIETFLKKETIIDFIMNYMILEESVDYKVIKAFRPYQYYGAKFLINHVNQNKNGYIWHATGSGKTLTSFKLATEIEKDSEISKVFFLLDRTDLENQTLKEFKNFIDDKDLLTNTNSTKHLKKKLLSNKPKDKLIITTFQKMERLSKKYSNDLKVIRAAIKKNVFIIDECHRTVNGEGMATIDRLFQNSVKLGLTGTPIFEENMDKTIGKTTKDIFENQCHTYMAINAISDKNILEFKIEYFSNLDKKNYDETTELKRKDEVVLQILKRYELLTKNREFNSMLTVNSKDDAIKYMELFKKTDIKTATIFTSDEQSDVQKGHLKRIIEEYNEVYGATCNIGDQKEYKKDLTNRMKNKEIDLLIVVQMFLTGFDSRLTNTLFVDKRLEYHGLLQAFSRTNRLSTKGNKDFGNIVVFSDIEKNIEDSLTLFSNGNSSDFKAKTYEESSKRLKGLIEELKREFPVASSIENETSEKRKREFIKKVSSVLSHIERVKSYKEFNQSDFDISDSETSEFRSKLQNLFSEAKRNKDKTEDFIKVEDFTSSLLKVDIISVDYLTDLIKGISQTSLESEVKKVEDLINNSDHLIKNRLLALLNSRVEGLEIDPKEEFKKDIENRKNKIFKLGYFIDVSCFEDFIDKVYKDFVLIESSDKFKNIDSFLKGCKSDLTFSEKIEIKNTFIEEVKSFIEFKDSISSS